MREKPCGGFQRNTRGQSLEITTACRSDNYNTFAEKAAAALNLKPLPHSFLCLFKPLSGARISNNDVVINQIPRPWNIGNYLLLLKKNPSNVQIGVAYVIDDSSLSDSDESHSMHVS